MYKHNDNNDELDIWALRLAYPNASRVQMKRLRRLAKRKNVRIPRPQPSEDLDMLLASIIRHEETHYEAMLKSGLSKIQARRIIHTRIDKTVNYLKGRDIC